VRRLCHRGGWVSGALCISDGNRDQLCFKLGVSNRFDVSVGICNDVKVSLGASNSDCDPLRLVIRLSHLVSECFCVRHLVSHSDRHILIYGYCRTRLAS